MPLGAVADLPILNTKNMVNNKRLVWTTGIGLPPQVNDVYQFETVTQDYVVARITKISSKGSDSVLFEYSDPQTNQWINDNTMNETAACQKAVTLSKQWRISCNDRISS